MKILDSGIAVLENDTHISRWVEQSGRLCHDGCVSLFILPLIHPGDVVVDGGAFIGDHTIAYLEKVGTNGRVLAFEPNPVAFECLKHNCPKAECFACGLGGSQALKSMSKNPNAGASSICESGTVFSVEIIPLDSLELPRLDFIKLDLEGFEVEALKGAVNTITAHRPVMVVEQMDGHLRRQGSSADELQSLLRHLRYTFKSLNPNLAMTEPQLDLLCEPIK